LFGGWRQLLQRKVERGRRKEDEKESIEIENYQFSTGLS
jgi:hypothetical protein